MSDPYFATGYVRLLYRFVRAEVEEDVLFQGTRCSARELMRADFEMPFAAQMRLIENALSRAAPGLGLRLGHGLQLASHGVLGTAMQTAPNLGAALDTFRQMVAARASFFRLDRVDTPRATTMTINVRDLPDTLVPFFSESILFSLTHCLQFYTGRRDSVDRIELGYPPPEYGAEYNSVFERSVTFESATTRISFEQSLLTLPSPEADPATFDESVRRCRSLMRERHKDASIVLRIEDFLLENPGKLWSAEAIAPLFAISERTLIRRLKAEGTTYQAVRDKALKQSAKSCLASMSVEATSLSLGFADTASFRRTFKRWFGVTPSEFRH